MTDKSKAEEIVSAASRPDERVVRHRALDRLYHWLMALATFVLLGTAFLPILGYKFEWVDIHWISGVLLTVLVLIHIVRALFWQDWRAMNIGLSDIRDSWRGFVGTFSATSIPPARPGKYNPLQKFYHFGVGLFMLAIIVTGLLMMTRIDTPFWRRNPYWLSNDWWGWIYAVHGIGSMAMVTMIIIHVYFAIRPEEWYLTRSMIRGWITRKELEKHHDSTRWRGD